MLASMFSHALCRPSVQALAALAFLVPCAGPLYGAGTWQILQQEGSDLVEFSAPKGGHHTLEIDDAFGFRTPVMKKTFSGSRLQVHFLEMGLIPGIDYHARLDGGRDVKDFRVELSPFTEPEVSCATLRRTWEETGRRFVGNSHSRVEWNAVTRTWVLLENHPLIGEALYYAEYGLRPALNGARACHDLEIFDEIAKYFTVMLQYTETVGTMLNDPNVLSLTRDRMMAADLLARTFPAKINGKVADGELYNVQWLHPAAELLRFISLLDPQQRTPAMQNFAAQYTPFIVRGQLDRYLVQQRLPLPGGGQGGRIVLWTRALAGLKGDTPWANKVSDIDLWLMDSAAEVLGANANDPDLAPLTEPQAQMLHRALEVGSRFVESRRNEFPTTRNFRGETVGSITYCNGDYAARPGYEYSAVTSENIPTPAQKLGNPDVGWDIMHSYRLPVSLRALYENRKATGADWPPYHEVQLFANHYVYRVFNGDYSRPLFTNYLDGSDGWEGVRGDFGYPPSRYCDQHNPHRPCTSPASIMGWGELAFANPELATLQHALVKLALEHDPQAEYFRNRYYFFENTPFELLGPPGKQTYALALYYVIGDDAEMILDRSAEIPAKNISSFNAN